MIMGLDLATGADITVLTKKVEIKHKCGHTMLRTLCGYSCCADIHGSPEKQIEDKTKYFEGHNCLVCKANGYGEASLERVQIPPLFLIGADTMPMKPKKLCKRCGAISDDTYCPEHMAEVIARRRKFFDDKRGSSSERGYDSRWQKLRLYKLAKDGLCEMCESEGKVERATMVHHIKPISQGGEALDYENLMSLCDLCHRTYFVELHSYKG